MSLIAVFTDTLPIASLADNLKSISHAFLSIVFEGAPYIMIGTLISGLIDAFLPANLIDRALPRNAIVAVFLAGFMGLFFPVCECAVVPVIRRLVQKGLPLSCAMTYMLSAPIINPIVAASTLTAFGEFPQGDGWSLGVATMTISRLSLGYAVAVIIGLVILLFKPQSILRPAIAATLNRPLANGAQAATPSFNSRLIHALRTAMSDFLDTGMYFCIGVIITSYFNTQIDQAILKTVAGKEIVAVPSIMGLGFILSLCSTSDAFIAAPMAAFSMAAKLAFLVFGPMMDVKLMFMYSAVFKGKVVVYLLLGTFFLIAILSHFWIPLALHFKP
jgi:uncharacterized membrane protein YraQ (UPF0718 family)